ncbi:MAG: glycoside hydrolase family 30 beta sandwich domain-containing protein [Acidobacteriaceae bacterium]
MAIFKFFRGRISKIIPLLLGWFFVLSVQRLGFSQEVHLIVSSASGDRLTSKPLTRFQTGNHQQGRTFEIHDDVRYQKIDGFGASFLEAGIMCINDLPKNEQEALLRTLFDPQKGAGFSAMKTVIASTDFMSAGPFYSYDPTPGDINMKDFSIARDLGPNGLITYIKRARRYGNFVLQAPMDYPPDWMLFDVNKNQDVNPKYYNALAQYYLHYLKDYAKNGVFINYLSLFNEPGNYTKIPYDEINRLLRDHVGPLLQKEQIRTQIMPSEAPTRENASRNYPFVLNDPISRKYIAVLPYHGYDFKNYGKIAAMHKKYPQFPLWMTEICYDNEDESHKWGPLPRYDFDDGDFWGNQIFDDLEASASAWIYWNMILDAHGGPWSVSIIHGNPDPNIQQPVVIVDRRTKKVTYTGLYYYLAHFSKFVRPGAVRIQTVGSSPGVRIISFASPDGGIVTEIMNSNKSAVDINLAFHTNTLHLHLPAISITTALWQKSQRK